MTSSQVQAKVGRVIEVCGWRRESVPGDYTVSTQEKTRAPCVTSPLPRRLPGSLRCTSPGERPPPWRGSDLWSGVVSLS